MYALNYLLKDDFIANSFGGWEIVSPSEAESRFVPWRLWYCLPKGQKKKESEVA